MIRRLKTSILTLALAMSLSVSASSLGLDFDVEGPIGSSLSTVENGSWVLLLKTTGINTDKLTAEIQDKVLVVSGNGNEINGKPERYSFLMEYHADSEAIMLTSSEDQLRVEVFLCD